jgi:hypothetical protein
VCRACAAPGRLARLRGAGRRHRTRAESGWLHASGFLAAPAASPAPVRVPGRGRDAGRRRGVGGAVLR